jgi:probable phosphoglycerate mutase
MRHGEAIANTKNILSSWPEKFYNHLTAKGIKQVKKSAEELKDKEISLIFSSDLSRAKQTAEIIGKKLKIKPNYDKRLREISMGEFNGESTENLQRFFKNDRERFKKRIPGGENYNDIGGRVYDFFKDINKKYSGGNILIVSHQVVFVLIEWKVKKLKGTELLKRIIEGKKFQTGQWVELKLGLKK